MEGLGVLLIGIGLAIAIMTWTNTADQVVRVLVLGGES